MLFLCLFCSVSLNTPESLFQILLSRDQSGAQLPPWAGNHLQRSETGQRAAGLWRTHQTYRLRHVQGVVYSLLCMKDWGFHDTTMHLKAPAKMHKCRFAAPSDDLTAHDLFVCAGGFETRRYNEHFLWYPQLHCPWNTQRRGLRWELQHTSTCQKCYPFTNTGYNTVHEAFCSNIWDALSHDYGCCSGAVLRFFSK